MHRQIQRVELICAFRYVICWDFCRFQWGKMTSKVHPALFLLFACTVTVSAVGYNFQGKNVKMVRNSASRTVNRILTRLTGK